MSFLSLSLGRARARSHFSAAEAGSLKHHFEYIDTYTRIHKHIHQAHTHTGLKHNLSHSLSSMCVCELSICTLLVIPTLRKEACQVHPLEANCHRVHHLSTAAQYRFQHHKILRTYIHTCMYTYICTQGIETCIHVHTHICTYTIRMIHTYTHTHTHTHTRTHTHTHTHVHIHLGCSTSRKLGDQGACMITGYEPDLEGNVCLSRLGTPPQIVENTCTVGSDQDSVSGFPQQHNRLLSHA